MDEHRLERRSAFFPIYFYPLLGLLCLVSRVTNQPATLGVRFFVLEEQPPGEYVVSLLKDFKLDFNDGNKNNNEFKPVSFSVVTRPAVGGECFSIDPRTGVVRTAVVVDRERLCLGSVERCVVLYYVAAQRANVFQILKLAVEIDDVNDNSPVSMRMLLNKFHINCRDVIWWGGGRGAICPSPEFEK